MRFRDGLRFALRVMLLALIPLLFASAGALAAEAATGATGMDQIPTLATGGTVGLITGMAILIGLFLSGRVERGAVSAEWKAVAQEQTKAMAVLVPSIEKVVNIAERLLTAVETMNTEARLRREFEQDRRDAGSTPHTRSTDRNRTDHQT